MPGNWVLRLKAPYLVRCLIKLYVFIGQENENHAFHGIGETINHIRPVIELSHGLKILRTIYIRAVRYSGQTQVRHAQ